MQKKQVKFKDALVTVIILTLIMFYAITVCKTNPHIPMLLGCAVASVISIKNGYRWVEIEEGMTNGIVQSLKSIIILMLIGILIGIWIEAGIVPTIIYYGLKIVSPRFFLTTVMIVCSIISMAVGSWGTAGTVGVAFMGMSQAMGVPLNITAGAVISGAYFGDKISPLSDSTNLASAVTGVDIFKNVSYMFPVAGLAYGSNPGRRPACGQQSRPDRPASGRASRRRPERRRPDHPGFGPGHAGRPPDAAPGSAASGRPAGGPGCAD